VSADVVTADGRLLTASATENEDLFWGLRGGSGNFGVVTSFEYQLHPVGTVLGGMVIHPFERARDVLRLYRDFSGAIPDELNTVGALLTAPEGFRVAAIAVCYNGSLEEGEKVLRPLCEFGPPLVDQVGPMPYPAVQSMMDATFPRGRQYYWKASLINRISDGAIDAMIASFAAAPSPHTVVGFQQLGNAANRVGEDETAFSHRDARYDFLMLAGWEGALGGRRQHPVDARSLRGDVAVLARRPVCQRRDRGCPSGDQGGVSPADLRPAHGPEAEVRPS